MVRKFVLGRNGVFIQEVIFVVPVGLETPRTALMEVVFDRGRDGSGILRQTEGDAGGVKPVGEDLGDGLPEAVNFYICADGQRQFLDRRECRIRRLGDHGDCRWFEGVVAVVAAERLLLQL